VVILKIKWKTLLICILLPVAAGGLSAYLTGGSMLAFGGLEKPPLTPPAWVFPVVWTALYILMGIASYLVLASGNSHRSIRTSLGIYGVQLAVNFFWPIIFFKWSMYFFAFVWLVVLWLFVALTFLLFTYHSKTAGVLILPYILWITFAGYLNLAIALLN